MPELVDPVVPAGTGPWGREPQPVIQGRGLCLRPWQVGDEEFLVSAYTDEMIQRWHVFTLTDVAEARRLIALRSRTWLARTGADWAITDGRAQLGRIGLRTLDLYEGTAEIAYWVAPEARGVGVATRALGLLTDWARENGLRRITLLHSTRNERSCRVAVRAGFRLEGTAVRSVRHTDGFHDMHLHTLLLDEQQDEQRDAQQDRPEDQGHPVSSRQQG